MNDANKVSESFKRDVGYKYSFDIHFAFDSVSQKNELVYNFTNAGYIGYLTQPKKKPPVLIYLSFNLSLY